MIRSSTVVLPTKDIDTDQIIAARFLTTTSRHGLGKNLFFDLRYDSEGRERPGFPMNDPAAKGCEILVAGNNFGCGSSREHAPWALLDYGFRAVISTEIADIFRNNSLKNGLVPVVVDPSTLASFPIDAFSRYCLVEGIDQLGYLRQHEDTIDTFEESRAWTP